MTTRRTKTVRRIAMALLALCPFMAAGAGANDSTSFEGSHSTRNKAKSSIRKPQIGRSMEPDTGFKLKVAFRGAISKIEKDESCRALFDNLVVNGLQALGRSRYQPPQSPWEWSQCSRSVAAYTVVGSNRVVICDHFHRLDRRAQSAVLIHEALHTAGMSETRVDSDAMTAEAITDMVEEACSLR
jgi:hypothetical protein